MNPLSSWLECNKMNPKFMISEFCRIFGLTMVSANGILSFTGGDGSPEANYVLGKTFNYYLEEIIKDVPVVTSTAEVPVVTEEVDNTSQGK